MLPAFGVGGPLVTLVSLSPDRPSSCENHGKENLSERQWHSFCSVLDVFSVAGYAVARLYTAALNAGLCFFLLCFIFLLLFQERG